MKTPACPNRIGCARRVREGKSLATVDDGSGFEHRKGRALPWAGDADPIRSCAIFAAPVGCALRGRHWRLVSAYDKRRRGACAPLGRQPQIPQHEGADDESSDGDLPSNRPVPDCDWPGSRIVGGAGRRIVERLRRGDRASRLIGRLRVQPPCCRFRGTRGERYAKCTAGWNNGRGRANGWAACPARPMV